jgi:predicted nucleic acid-binding protein
VSQVVLLDSGPLGLVPRLSPKSLECAEWLQDLLAGGADIVVPEIADYEVRRELLRAGKAKGLERLDDLAGALRYLPITSAAMRQAAAFWAQARHAGKPTAPDLALDADAILAGQAATMVADDVVIATANVGNLSRFVSAALWHTIEADEASR